MTDITAIITGHREARLSLVAFRSFYRAVENARAGGLVVQEMLVLDRPDDLTREIFATQGDADTVRLETDFGDQGRARNLAVEKASGRLIAFLDADDMWPSDWLLRAYRFLQQVGEENVVAHPEFNYFFEGQATIFRHIDQDSDEFSPDLLRMANYWDALALCRRDLYLRFPFAVRDIANGWAYEDWHWNATTYAAGIRHKVVPDTVVFKRRQRMSQTVAASANKSRHRRTPLADYSNPIYAEDKEDK